MDDQDQKHLAEALETLAEGGVPSDYAEPVLIDTRAAAARPQAPSAPVMNASDAASRAVPQLPSGLRPPAPHARMVRAIASAAPAPRLIQPVLAPAAPVARLIAAEIPDPPIAPIAPTTDDDLLTLSSLADHAAGERLAVVARGAPPKRSQFVRRTIIPILLTLGGLVPAIGAWVRVQPPESSFHSLGTVFPLAMFIAGPVLLLIAAINMAIVRAELRSPSSRGV